MHLWTDGDAPPEWQEYILCKQFHKLPSEIRSEPYGNVLQLLVCMDMEQKVANKRAGKV